MSLTLTPATEKLICRALARGEEDAYLTFAGKAWGRGSVQATASRLAWLYERNPNSRGMQSDLLVLWHESEIVGAHHRMRLPWRIRDARMEVPSLHDLAVLPAYRRGGGLQLILAALAGEARVALLGLSNVSDEIYRRMSVPTLKLFWLERNRNPLAAGLQVLASHLVKRREHSLARGNVVRNQYQFSRIMEPSEQDLMAAVSMRPAAEAYVDWDLPSFRWRFFDAEGPANLLFLARSGTEIVGRAVLSIGLRHGLPVGRLVDMVISQPECQNPMIEVINDALDELKISFAFFTTSSRELADAWIARGWHYKNNPPGARWFSRDRSAMPRFWIQGGAWDFGCDPRIAG